MKRIAPVCLFLLLVALLALPTSAAGLNEAIVEAMTDRLVEGMEQLETEIDLSVGNISSRELFYAYFNEAWSRAFDRSVIADTQIVDTKHSAMVYRNQARYSAEIAYFPDAAEKISALNAVLDDLLAGVDPGWGEVETLLYLHDTIVLRYAYDETSETDSVYEMIERGIGICHTYTDLYASLLDRLEMPNDRAYGPNHVWNVVRLSDGEWYHIDVTWGDPVPDTLGQVAHNYFLVSDAVRRIRYDQPFEITESPVRCTSTRFDDANWRGQNTRIVSLDGKWYMLNNEDKAIVTYMPETDTVGEKILDIDDIWYVWGEANRYWTYSFSGLVAHAGRLYYNTSTEIRRYDPQTGRSERYHIPDTARGYLYGIVREGDSLRYLLRQAPDEADIATGTCALPLDLAALYARVMDSGLPEMIKRTFSVVYAQVIAP